MTSRSGRRSIGVVLGALLCAVAISLPADAERGGDRTVKVSYTGLGAERVKTVPIAKNSGGKTRVAMSLGPAKVGQVGQNDSVWAGAEVEVSITCLEPMPKCVGKIYHYSPYVKARLVLARRPEGDGQVQHHPDRRARSTCAARRSCRTATTTASSPLSGLRNLSGARTTCPAIAAT